MALENARVASTYITLIKGVPGPYAAGNKRMVIIVGSGKRAAKDIYSVQSVRVWWVILENVGGEVGDPMDNFEDIR